MSDNFELLTRPLMNNAPTKRSVIQRILGINPNILIDPNDLRAPGIDVSNWNTNINWSLVGQNMSPLSYAFVKSTEGTSYLSGLWRSQWDNLALLGIPRSSYHFWRGNLSGSAQATWFLSKSAKGELPPVLDVEDADNVPQILTASQKASYLANIKSWLDTVQSAWNQVPIIYSGKWFWDRFGFISWANSYPGWFATYRPLDSVGPFLPIGWDHWHIWQHSSDGQVSGFPERVDLNRYNGTVQQFKSWAGIVEELTDHQKVEALWDLHPELWS